MIGEVDRLSPRTRRAMDSLVDHTAGGRRLRLNLAISYGSRTEIVNAARRLAERVLDGTLVPGEIDEELFGRHLYTASDPDPDLLIRTSGEMRISNFMLWQLAYSEIHVTPRAMARLYARAPLRRHSRVPAPGAPLRARAGELTPWRATRR
jgi:undecaprenyl diphosphate synthase